MQKVRCAIIFLLSATALFGSWQAEAADRNQFLYRAPLNGTFIPQTPTGVVLPGTLMEHTLPTLSDVRLFDDQGREQQFIIFAVRAKSSGAPAATVYDDFRLERPEVEPMPGGDTAIHLGAVNLPFEKLHFEIADPIYDREVSLWGSPDRDAAHLTREAGGKISHDASAAAAHDTLDVGPRHRFLEVRIHNAAAPPLTISALRFSWARRILYFFPEEGRSYRLYFGNEEVGVGRYPIKKVLTEDKLAELQPSSTLTVGKTENNSDYVPNAAQPKPKGIPMIWVVLFLVLLVAGFPFYRSLRHPELAKKR